MNALTISLVVIGIIVAVALAAFFLSKYLINLAVKKATARGLDQFRAEAEQVVKKSIKTFDESAVKVEKKRTPGSLKEDLFNDLERPKMPSEDFAGKLGIPMPRPGESFGDFLNRISEREGFGDMDSSSEAVDEAEAFEDIIKSMTEKLLSADIDREQPIRISIDYQGNGYIVQVRGAQKKGGKGGNINPNSF